MNLIIVSSSDTSKTFTCKSYILLGQRALFLKCIHNNKLIKMKTGTSFLIILTPFTKVLTTEN